MLMLLFLFWVGLLVLGLSVTLPNSVTTTKSDQSDLYISEKFGLVSYIFPKDTTAFSPYILISIKYPLHMYLSISFFPDRALPCWLFEVKTGNKSILRLICPLSQTMLLKYQEGGGRSYLMAPELWLSFWRYIIYIIASSKHLTPKPFFFWIRYRNGFLKLSYFDPVVVALFGGVINFVAIYLASPGLSIRPFRNL